MLSSQVIDILKRIPEGTPPEHYIISRIEAVLPKCKQRAIATIHCTMIENEYKDLVEMYKKFNYNLHQKFQTILQRLDRIR